MKGRKSQRTIYEAEDLKQVLTNARTYGKTDDDFVTRAERGASAQNDRKSLH